MEGRAAGKQRLEASARFKRGRQTGLLTFKKKKRHKPSPKQYRVPGHASEKQQRRRRKEGKYLRDRRGGTGPA